MSLSVSAEFKKVSAKPAKPRPKRKRPYSLSVRLSDEERALLERKAGSRPLGAYVRQKVLGEFEEKRRESRAKPSLDAALLGRLLGLLGKSDQVKCLFLLLAAAEAERVSLTEEDRTALREACADAQEMRSILIKALGLKPGNAQ